LATWRRINFQARAGGLGLKVKRTSCIKHMIRGTAGGARMEANKAYFMVRAEVPSESDRAKFDQWYGTHHLPLAMDKFQAEKGWRFWSRSDHSVHYALYQFKDMATLRDCLNSPGFKLLVADFDQAWPRVTRSRDLIEVVQQA
jgi:hypothetical protein